MGPDYSKRFSQIAGNMKRSAIRELLKLTQRPDIISFAGGLPSPETFPIEDLLRISSEVLEKEGSEALQYGTTEGNPELRKILAQRYVEKEQVNVDPDQLIITTASQQGLDLLGRIFLDPGDVVICGLPSYLGGISAFMAYGASMMGIPFDHAGMRPDILRSTIRELIREGEKIKFIYLIPDFQNPAGITLPRQRRIEILEIAEAFDLLIVEDSPYREIRFEGDPVPMMLSLDHSGRVITIGTLSKILAPGLRLGWMIGPAEILDKVVMAKQTADLCTPELTQRIAVRYLRSESFERNLRKTVDLYHSKRDVMLNSLEKYMPEGVTWTRPEGGLFLFLELPPDMDAEKLLQKSIKHGVAFVAGSVFFCSECGQNTMRINFSYASRQENIYGIQKLAGVIREEMNNRK